MHTKCIFFLLLLWAKFHFVKEAFLPFTTSLTLLVNWAGILFGPVFVPFYRAWYSAISASDTKGRAPEEHSKTL